MGFYESDTRIRMLLSLFGGFLLHIVLGTEYITGNISLYIASYLQYKGHDVTIQDISIILPLQVIGTALSLALGPYLTSRFNPWLTTSIGNSIVVSSVFFTSFLSSYSSIILIYGLFFGIGVGISVRLKQYTTPLIISWSHFPEHKGRISGVIVSGFGFGSSIFNLVSTSMINPDNKGAHTKHHGNEYFDDEIANRLPNVLRLLALIYLVLSVIGVLLLARPAKSQEICGNEIKLKDEECPDIKSGLKTQSFWLLCVMAFCSITPGMFVVSVYKNFGKEKIDDDGFLTIVGSVSSIFNGSFRYIWGQLMDRSSFKTSYLILLSVQAVLIVTLYYIAEFKALYLIWVSIILCCEGGHFALLPTVFARMYGKIMGAKLYCLFFYSIASGAVLSFLIFLFLTSIIGYQGLFWIMGGLTVASFAFTFLFKELSPWLPSTYPSKTSFINRQEPLIIN